MRDQPGHTNIKPAPAGKTLITYPILMARINAAAASRGFQIPEMASYREMSKLRQLLADGEANLQGSQGAVDPDDIPF